jgi:hypothetical protein
MATTHTFECAIDTNIDEDLIVAIVTNAVNT